MGRYIGYPGLGTVGRGLCHQCCHHPGKPPENPWGLRTTIGVPEVQIPHIPTQPQNLLAYISQIDIPAESPDPGRYCQAIADAGTNSQ